MPADRCAWRDCDCADTPFYLILDGAVRRVVTTRPKRSHFSLCLEHGRLASTPGEPVLLTAHGGDSDG